MRPLLVAFVSLLSVGCGCALVDSGQVGVSYSLGKIDPEPLAPGVYFSFPVIRYVSRWNVKTQEHKEQTQVPSSEGMIVGLDASGLYCTKTTAPSRTGALTTMPGTLCTRRLREVVSVPRGTGYDWGGFRFRASVRG